MRIISGEYKGRVIKTKLPEGVRPTTDRNREYIFNILNNHIDFDEIIALDLFSGSGLLGIESISRGALFCFFNDKNNKINRYNLEFLNELKVDESKYKTTNYDALTLLNYLVKQNNFLNENQLSEIDDNPRINLIFSDPPYSSRMTNKILELLIEATEDKSSIHVSSYIVLEYSYIEKIDYNNELYKNKIEVLNQKTLGETKIDILRLNC